MSNNKEQPWHLSRTISISVIIGLIINIFMSGWFLSDLSNKVNSNTIIVNDHHSNKLAHMPFEEKIKVFVPRVELEKDMAAIRKSQDEIKQDIKILIRNSK